jgi:hypothetical protein
MDRRTRSAQVRVGLPLSDQEPEDLELIIAGTMASRGVSTGKESPRLSARATATGNVFLRSEGWGGMVGIDGNRGGERSAVRTTTSIPRLPTPAATHQSFRCGDRIRQDPAWFMVTVLSAPG